jgi:hypothetical protein
MLFRDVHKEHVAFLDLPPDRGTLDCESNLVTVPRFPLSLSTILNPFYNPDLCTIGTHDRNSGPDNTAEDAHPDNRRIVLPEYTPVQKRKLPGSDHSL